MKKGIVEVSVETLSKDLTKKVVNKKTENKKAQVKAKNEAEELGVIEINNSSASKRNKNVALGYEKHTTSAKKKAVSSKVTAQEDYFDFDLRANKNLAGASKSQENKTAISTAKPKKSAQTEEFLSKVAEKTRNSASKTAESGQKTAKITEKAKISSEYTKTSNTVAETKLENGANSAIQTVKAESQAVASKNDDIAKNVSASAEECKVFSFDEEAERIISIARMGTLFDCVKNC